MNSLPLSELMASFNNQAGAASASKLVLPITGGSCSEPANKKQKKEAQRRVQHVGVQGPFIKSRWSHIPITFSQEDLQLKDYPHNDAMVISCVIKGFLVHNVLVDTGSAADIIFAKAFRQMQEPEDKIHDATHPLCGFGGRQIVALGKITMPVTFGFVNNTRTEQVVFDIVDMEYPYNQAGAASASKLVLPITGGSCSEPANKKQKKEAQRRVQHVGVQGPFIKSRWSHIPITFSQEDLQLKDYPHNDAMVISCVIKGFLVHNVLVDTGSAADIIFAKAFRQMQEPEDKIHDATHPLCGFGGRQIVALGKITMPVTFGFVNNTRTEQVVFDIVDMEYPYNAIIGRGTLNAFEAILHPAYLCMKIPSDQGPIAIHGSQEAARRAEGSVQRILYLLRPLDRCKSQRIRFMMLHTLLVASEEGRL